MNLGFFPFGVVNDALAIEEFFGIHSGSMTPSLKIVQDGNFRCFGQI